jgi:hypothetical protein
MSKLAFRKNARKMNAHNHTAYIHSLLARFHAGLLIFP